MKESKVKRTKTRTNSENGSI